MSLQASPAFSTGGDGEVVCAGGAGEADPLALEVGQALQGRARRHQYGRTGPRRFDRRDIDQLGLRRLGEDRRRIARRAVVDAADIERLEQRRPERELDPLDLDAERLQPLLEHALLLGDQQRAAALVSEAQLARLAGCGFRGRLRDGGRGEERARQGCNQMPSLDHRRLQRIVFARHGSPSAGMALAVPAATAGHGVAKTAQKKKEVRLSRAGRSCGTRRIDKPRGASRVGRSCAKPGQRSGSSPSHPS